MDRKTPKLQPKSILKKGGKYLYNEDGTPVVINGKYLYLNEDGTTSLQDHHPHVQNLEKELAQITGEELQDVKLELGNSLDSVITESEEPASEEAKEAASEANWDIESTQLFLSLYKIMKGLLIQHKIPTQRKMWIKIAKRLQEHGYDFSPSQVETRYKTLVRSYRRKMEGKFRKRRLVKDTPYESEVKELYENDKMHTDIVITPEGEEMNLVDFLQAAGISGERPVQYIAGGARRRKVYKYSTGIASKHNLKHPVVITNTPPKSMPPSSPAYYTNHARRTDLMEELRDLRVNTLEKLRTMEDKRDTFNKNVLQELRYRNELLEKLLEHVP